MSFIGWYRVFWLGLFATMVVMGMPRPGRAPVRLPLVDRGPSSSVNAVFANTLGNHELAEPLADWLGRLSPETPLLVVAQSGNSSALLTANLVSYLAWPRPVDIVWGEKLSKAKLPRPPEVYGAVGWCLLPPPPAKFSRTFGQGLTFISTQPLPE